MLEVFGSTSEDNYATKYIFKQSRSKCSSGQVGGNFYEPTELFLRVEFWGSKSENRCKIYFFGKKQVYPGIISLDTRNAILKNLPKISTKTENLPLKLRNKKKTKIKQHDFSKFKLSREKNPDTKIARLWALSKKKSLKIWKVVRWKNVGKIIITEVVHVERKFDSHAKSLCQNSQKLLLKRRKELLQ